LVCVEEMGTVTVTAVLVWPSLTVTVKLSVSAPGVWLAARRTACVGV
jgi:hypothetical protein